ncbi:MAG: c-type cytochrome [Acidiphilium sp.]|nr:c-type cytochrome [Acidiphilium sp.]MDD4935644.1 c-type cytochrome [Acidiphilium sp.]
MKLFIIATVAAAALTLTTASAQTMGNAAMGKQVYLHQCSGCHSNKPGVDRFGPTLAGVYGRMSGSAPLHHYSAAMKAAHIIWNNKTLNLFLQNPRDYVRGTVMPYRGLRSARARLNVIAYLKSISPLQK